MIPLAFLALIINFWFWQLYNIQTPVGGLKGQFPKSTTVILEDSPVDRRRVRRAGRCQTPSRSWWVVSDIHESTESRITGAKHIKQVHANVCRDKVTDNNVPPGEGKKGEL